jgi:short-subunit dehydrogenase
MSILTGQPVVLVTGASSGIGKATAELLSREGFRVFGTSRRPQGKSANGFELLPLEVASDESVARCVESVLQASRGQIDVLVNNAGTGIFGAVEEVSADEARRLFEVNFFGVMRMTTAVLPHMRSRRSGRIITMSSSGGLASLPFAGIYCATKFALEAYTAALYHEVRPFGIAASAVAPGPVSTSAGDTAMRAERVIEEYSPRRQRVDAIGVRHIRNGIDPARVARTILRVIRARKPRPRYSVGMQARATSLGRRLLPPLAFEALIGWGTGSG